jgi:hypothetical protein
MAAITREIWREEQVRVRVRVRVRVGIFGVRNRR